MKKRVIKSGSEVEVKFSLPLPIMPLYKGVSEDLVEVEDNFQKIFERQLMKE